MEVKRFKKGDYRFYKIGNLKPLPSVTSILSLLPKPLILYWAVSQTIKFLIERGDVSKQSTSLAYSIHKKLLTQTANEGTRIHKLIEEYELKGIDSDHNAVTRYKKFVKESGFNCRQAEITLWDNKIYYTAGTADLIGDMSDIPIILDIKTSKEIRLSHKIQSCIYKELYCIRNKLDSSKVKSGVILLPRNSKTKYDYHINSDEEERKYKKIFILLSKLFRLLLSVNELKIT